MVEIYIQELGQAMPEETKTGHYKKYSHFKERDTAPTTSSREGSCIIDSSTLGERTLRWYTHIKNIVYVMSLLHGAILSRDRTEDDEIFCTALPIHLCVQSMA